MTKPFFKDKENPCKKCTLSKNAENPFIPTGGEGRLKILLIGDSPGIADDKVGKHFQGVRGQVLRRIFRQQFRIDIDKDCWLEYSNHCLCTKEEGPTDGQIKTCAPRLRKVIEELKPKLIITLSSASIWSLCHDLNFEKKYVSDKNWRGIAIPEYRFNTWVVPMYSLRSLIKNKSEAHKIGNAEHVFVRDLRYALQYRNKPLPKPLEPNIAFLYTKEEVDTLFTKILQENLEITYDYETNHLKPFLKKSKVLCTGISSVSGTWAFPNLPKNKSKWKQILKSNKVKKIAQNISFEEKWNRFLYGTTSKGWVWDTMVVSHLLGQGRAKHSGLKIQAYLKFGILDYNREADKLIKKTDEEGCNALHTLPLEKLLLYVGKDAYYTRKLKEKQEKEEWVHKVYKLYHEGLLALIDAECTGIKVDEEYYINLNIELTKKMEREFTKIMHSPSVQKFKDVTKRDPTFVKKSDGKYSFSTLDVKQLLFEIEKNKPSKMTEKGNISLDKEVMESMKSSFCKSRLRLSKLQKVRDAFLKPFLTNVYNGRIYPSYNLHIARSGRSSSSDPNFQNIPKHDPEVKEMIRKGIITDKGFKLAESDYSSMEVKVIACHSKDPVLIKYINSGADPHKDQAALIFKTSIDNITVDMRNCSKSLFVFPEFYGSWYKMVAGDLWDACKDLKCVDGRKALAPWKNYNSFESHMKVVEDHFWYRFSVVKKWQEQRRKSYEKLGYVESFIGYRRGGYLKRTQICNTDVQCDAFHCLLKSFVLLNNERKEKEWETTMPGQIHDAILFEKDDNEDIFPVVQDIMCNQLAKEFKWLIVPMEVKSEIGENWAYMKGVE